MTAALRITPSPAEQTGDAPGLDAVTRQRLGWHLRALYEPVIDEQLDPRLAELIDQLEQARSGNPSP